MNQTAVNYSTTYLPSYSVGADCYREIPQVTRHYGTKAVVIGGKTAMAKAKAALTAALQDSPVEILDFVWYGGNSTYQNVEELKKNPAVVAADMVFGVGGGRAVDTCKVVCDQMDKPLFTFPTIASNCAGCTAISVMYNEDDTFREYFYPKQPPLHCFINTQIIAEAPETLLWAGIGDALSKEYEVQLASRGKTLSHTPLMGVQLSRSCTGPLVEFGAKALEDCRRGRDSEALQEVSLSIIISTGLVSNMTNCPGEYYYNSSLAHCVYYGYTTVPHAAGHLHGEVVAYGVLTLLAYDGQKEELERIMRFNHSIGLPVCLADMDLTPDDLAAIADKAETVLEWSCVPQPADRQRFIDAMLECDAMGRRMFAEKKKVS